MSQPKSATSSVSLGSHPGLQNPTDTNTPHPEFNFYPGAHRVARAAFGWPCIPYEYATINQPGFYTGVFEPQVVSNDVSTSNPPFTIPQPPTHPPHHPIPY
jgi:hypothetical protein